MYIKLAGNVRKLEEVLSKLLHSYAQLFKIAYAILYQPHKDCSPMLTIRFEIDEFEERFKLLLEFTTILPSTPINVYDIQSLPKGILKTVFRYGKILFIEDYELYLKDLKQAILSI